MFDDDAHKEKTPPWNITARKLKMASFMVDQ